MTYDGGPAYPTIVPCGGNTFGVMNGMSLRDWFAGQALAGMLADPGIGCTPDHAPELIGTIAAEAYQMADAMIKARGQ